MAWIAFMPFVHLLKRAGEVAIVPASAAAPVLVMHAEDTGLYAAVVKFATLKAP